MCENKSALRVKRLHVEHPIHADGGPLPQPVAQAVPPPIPKVTPDPLPAQIRSHDEEPHETKRLAIGDHRTGADDFTVPLDTDKPLGIGRPKQIRIPSPRIPPLGRRPLHRQIQLRPCRLPIGVHERNQTDELDPRNTPTGGSLWNKPFRRVCRGEHHGEPGAARGS